MERPYVICHMLTSMDGKIDGSWFSHPACEAALKAYGELPKSKIVYSREDYLAVREFGNYIVCLDAEGILGWESGFSEKKGRGKAHVIEVLTEKVGNDYLAYLREKNVSYLFAGENEIDCELFLQKLQKLFGVSRVILAGGGITNWNFAKSDLIDEMSIVMAPVADGSTQAVSIFEDTIGTAHSMSMMLKSVKQLGGDALWLTYIKEGGRNNA